MRRNETLYDMEFQKQRLRKWYEDEKEKGLNGDHEQVRRFIRKNDIKVEISSNETIQNQIKILKRIKGKAVQIKLNDISRYFDLK